MKFKFKPFRVKADKFSICLQYNRWNNGNADLFIHFYSLNLIIYINGLDQYKESQKTFIKC